MAAYRPQIESQLLEAISRTHEFDSLGVAFIGNGQCSVLREPAMPEGYRTWLVLVEEERPPELVALPPVETTDSTVGRETINLVLSCGSAVLAGAAATASAGAAPLTAGSSLVITYLGYAAAVASAAQCGIAGGRVFNSIFSPNGNEALDSLEWMNTVSNTLDAIAIAGGIAGLGQAARSAILLSRSSGKPLKLIIQGMTRAERKRLAQDLARYSGQAPTRRAFIRLARAGKLPKIFTQKQISKALISQLLDNIGAAFTMAGSSYSGLISVYFAEDQ